MRWLEVGARPGLEFGLGGGRRWLDFGELREQPGLEHFGRRDRGHRVSIGATHHGAPRLPRVRAVVRRVRRIQTAQHVGRSRYENCRRRSHRCNGARAPRLGGFSPELDRLALAARGRYGAGLRSFEQGQRRLGRARIVRHGGGGAGNRCVATPRPVCQRALAKGAAMWGDGGSPPARHLRAQTHLSRAGQAWSSRHSLRTVAALRC